MRQVVLEQPGRFLEQAGEAPAAGADEALVRVRRIGVCGTDLHAFAGRQPFFAYPRILGHELAVEVLEAPPNDYGVTAGDHCSVEPYVNNPQSAASLRGRPNCCEDLKVLGVHVDGGMRGLLAVPVRLLHKSERLDWDQLALVETLGIGQHAVERSRIESGTEALVVGAGPIGLAALQFLAAEGAKAKVLELSPERRRFVQGLGFEALERPDGKLYDFVFDATGSKAAMEAAFDYCAHGATLVFIGLVQDRISFDDPTFHRRELTLLASRNSAHAFPKIISMIENGRIDTRPWINQRFALRETVETFPRLRAIPDLVKAVIEVEDSDV